MILGFEQGWENYDLSVLMWYFKLFNLVCQDGINDILMILINVLILVSPHKWCTTSTLTFGCRKLLQIHVVLEDSC